MKKGEFNICLFSPFLSHKNRRYVLELTKLKETFIEPLLHPYASASVTSPTPHDHDDFYARGGESPRESFDHLPIASRFLSPTPGLRAETPAVQAPTMTAKDSTPNIDGDSFDTDDEEAQNHMGKGYGNGATQRRNGRASALAAAVDKLNHPRSPYNTNGQRNKQTPKQTLSFPSRSHQSLPPPPRPQQESSASLGRQSTYGAVEREREREVSYAATQHTQQTGKSASSRVLKKLRRATGQTEVMMGDSVAPAQLPEDLRKCLEVLESGIYDGHVTLSEGLRKRYEEQYPLVRSLADVFVANVSHSFLSSSWELIISFTSQKFCENMRNTCFIWNVLLSKLTTHCPLRVTRRSQKIKMPLCG